MNSTLSEMTQIWDKTLLEIKKKINEPNIFEYFFSKSYIDNISNNKMTVIVNSNLAVELLSTKYLDLIKSVLADITDQKYEMKFICASENVRSKKEQAQKVESSYFESDTLNKELTFDNFVVGDFNREASQAALLVSSNPGKMFNPLYLYSGSGLGKTHLLHAIGNNVILKANPKAKILYITAEDFVEKYIKFVRGDKDAQELKSYVSNFDVLLLDDVQFLEDKVKTQEFFFYIYQKMINSNKQIVITSDKQPSELKSIEDRLVTRFSQGLVVKINEPDLNTCVEILKEKITANHLDLNCFDEGVLEYFADKFSRNVRELEGALNRLIFYAFNLKQSKRISMELATESVASLTGSKKMNKMTEIKIINEVADYYNLTPNQLTGKIRTGEIALARHIAMYLIREIMDVPLKKIGDIFGGKDHTTVMSAISKVDKELKTNDSLRKAISDIKVRLKV